jgi:hypothetical protein
VPIAISQEFALGTFLFPQLLANFSVGQDRVGFAHLARCAAPIFLFAAALMVRLVAVPLLNRTIESAVVL